jgi:glucosamine-6-phosphate deaminase
MSITLFPNYEALCREAAARIANLIRQKPGAVLGLATGSTPLGVYRELIRLHREAALDFSRVRTFNLDEYFPLEPDAPQSYVRYMRENLFDHVNIAPEHWHVPDGRAIVEGQRRDDEQIKHDCENYEKLIADAGGLDLQLLGIGRTGHIGFNEPGSPQDSRTRLVVLDHLTRADAAEDFYGLENVPVRAITMGVSTILNAREIIFMATGERKAAIVREALEGKITSKVPASFLREHPNTLWFLDTGAASQLREYSHPWQKSEIDFHDFAQRRRAFIGAAQSLDKSLQKLAARDFHELGLSRLVHSVPSLEAALQETELDLKRRTEDTRFLPQNQNVLCLSPHPDDDVICCGATLLKLAQRSNNLTVAYGVSGSRAVRDKDVLALLRARHPRLVSYIEEAAPLGQSFEDVFKEIRLFLFEREAGQPDSDLLRNLKRLVREGEASDACRKMGARPQFWRLPFYEQNRDGKRELFERADVEIALQSLRETQPDIVMLTGEMSDPHGTHEICAQVFENAAREYLNGGGKPFVRWNYRGAWEEFAVWEGDFFSLFNKEMMERKVGLILDHISQLDPLFPGNSDPREFYERARDRNRATARQLQQLGILPPSRSFDPIYAEVFQIKS